MAEPPPGHGSGSDPLAGSPELFATNLLLTRCIENRMVAAHLRRENGVHVHLEGPEGTLEEETLTEEDSRWSDVRDRFREMTNFDEEQSGELELTTPAAGQVKTVRVSYPDPDTIHVRFDYPETSP